LLAETRVNRRRASERRSKRRPERRSERRPFFDVFDGGFLRFVINILIDVLLGAATKRSISAVVRRAPLFIAPKRRPSRFASRRDVPTVSTALKRPKRSFGAVVTLCLTILFVRKFPPFL